MKAATLTTTQATKQCVWLCITDKTVNGKRKINENNSPIIIIQGDTALCIIAFLPRTGLDADGLMAVNAKTTNTTAARQRNICDICDEARLVPAIWHQSEMRNAAAAAA